MMTATGLRTNAGLVTEEATRVVREETAEQVRLNLVARGLVPTIFTENRDEYRSYKETGMAGSTVTIGVNDDTGEDTLLVVKQDQAIWTIQQKFTIPWHSMNAGELENLGLLRANVREAAYQNALEENNFILDGHKPDGTNYDMPGLFQSAGNTFAGGTWATATNILSNISSLIALMHADGIVGPFSLVLHPDQFNEVMSAQISGIPTQVQAKNILGDERGEGVFVNDVTATIATGTALLVPNYQHKFFQLTIGQDHRTNTWFDMSQDPDTADMLGRTMFRGVMTFDRTESIGTLTGI